MKKIFLNSFDIAKNAHHLLVLRIIMKQKQIYIIEHLEPELGKWCLIEYAHISKIVGKNNLYFTNITNNKDARKLSKLGKVFKESVSKLNLANSCVLDPEAEKTLEPREAKKFQFFIFGGILGDFPPRKRTEIELTEKIKFKAEKRNIGKPQMSTDNAIYTVGQITKGKKLQDLKFQDTVSIKINKILTIELPYRYNLVNEKPLISKKLINHIKRTER